MPNLTALAIRTVASSGTGVAHPALHAAAALAAQSTALQYRGDLLRWLYIIAGVLAVVLVLVVWLAIKAWKKNEKSDLHE